MVLTCSKSTMGTQQYVKSVQNKQNEVIDVNLVSILLTVTDFAHCFVVSIVDFEQLNADWVCDTVL